MVTEETKARFLGMYCMVLADGVIDSRELETLYRIGIDVYGLHPEDITASIREAGSSFIAPKSTKDKIRFLYDLALIAWADEVLEDKEVDLIKSYAVRLGFEDENCDEITSYLLSKAKSNESFDSVLNEIITSK